MPNDNSHYPLLEQLELAGLVGRGGAGFPIHLKWLRLKELGKPVGYVVCNASEGELNVHKDAHILEHFPEMVIDGMVAAMQFLDTKQAYFNIKRPYFERFGEILKTLTDQVSHEKGFTFHYFIEEPSYIGGESGAMLNAIEGKRTQPRLSPPSPSIIGIHGHPVLVNNVETFYDVARVISNTFEPTRFITLVGPIPNPGVYNLNRDLTVEQALIETNNVPHFDYFIQVGGSASGEVINRQQAATHKLTGCGSVEVFGQDAVDYDVLKRWFDFYALESCGKCGPCREGTYVLKHKLDNLQPGEELPWEDIRSICQTLKTTSFCDLGKSLPIPVESYMKNILGLEAL
jgi:NADH:ubiquinone oxidoreductase subunit F (NADH-binding)